MPVDLPNLTFEEFERLVAEKRAEAADAWASAPFAGPSNPPGQLPPPPPPGGASSSSGKRAAGRPSPPAGSPTSGAMDRGGSDDDDDDGGGGGGSCDGGDDDDSSGGGPTAVGGGAAAVNAAANVGFFYPPALMERLKAKKLLHWVITHPDDISRANFLMGAHKTSFEQLADYDLTELRAVYAVLPEVGVGDTAPLGGSTRALEMHLSALCLPPCRFVSLLLSKTSCCFKSWLAFLCNLDPLGSTV